MTVRLIALSILAATSMLPQVVSQPKYYDATLDTIVRTKPPLPANIRAGVTGAGSLYVDPAFNTPILRVTDGASLGTSVPFYTMGGSFDAAWNTDSTKFAARDDNGWSHLFAFDPAHLKTQHLGTLPIRGVSFSSVNPNTVFGVYPAQLMTGGPRYLAVCDLTGAVPTNGNAPDNCQMIANLTALAKADPNGILPTYTASASADARTVSVAYGGSDGHYRYVLSCTLDSTGAACTSDSKILDVSTWNVSTIGGGSTITIATPLATGATVHSAALDRTGRYVHMDGYYASGAYLGSSSTGAGVFWDISGNQINDIPRGTNTSGHQVNGFGIMINQSGWNSAISDARGFSRRSLDAAGLGNPTQLLPQNPPPAPSSWNDDGHWSWANLKSASELVPVVGTFYRQDPSAAWLLWDDEAVAADTNDGSNLYRFLHHRSYYDGSNFWDTPRGNVSQDGRYFIFSSNWERTLGSNRQDVFLAVLPLSGATQAAPTGAIETKSVAITMPAGASPVAVLLLSSAGQVAYVPVTGTATFNMVVDSGATITPYLPGYSFTQIADNNFAAKALPIVFNTDPSVSSITRGLTFTVNGDRFDSSAKVLWNGTALQTKFVSPQQLTATAPRANAGSYAVSVQQSNGTSNAVLLIISGRSTGKRK